MVVVEQRSRVTAPVEVVWARVASAEGINDEMRPWMTMSPPRGTHLDLTTIEVGVPAGRCWLRLFGVIPFDYDDLMVASLEPGRSFHEKSTMLSMKRWEHERTLTPVDGGTEVHDRLTFEPRAEFMVPVLRRVVAFFFAHRHRRLARHFG